MDVHRTLWSLCEVPPPRSPPNATSLHPLRLVTQASESQAPHLHPLLPKQVTRPAVAMDTSHSQSRGTRGGGVGGPNHKDDSITSSIGSAAPRQSLFSMQHFCNTRFNHLAAILLNAVYHGKESEREREREREMPDRGSE